MTAYLDASVIVAAFSREVASEAAFAWLAGPDAEQLVTSKWCFTEVTSAMAIKTRTGALAAESLDAVLAAVREMLTASARNVAIEDGHFDVAAELVRCSATPLRGGDALHLAVARGAGATLWTLDRKMAAAGQSLALDVRLLA